MRWVLIVAAVLVSAALAVVVVGMLLPRAHVASRTARVGAPPERVWGVVTAVADFPSWRPDVTGVEVLPPVSGRAAWRETSRHGRVTYEATEMTPPRRLVTRIADRDLPYGGAWEYEITPEGDGSRVTITERGEVYNPVFRFMSRFVFGHTATIDAYLAALTRRLGPAGK